MLRALGALSVLCALAGCQGASPHVSSTTGSGSGGVASAPPAVRGDASYLDAEAHAARVELLAAGIARARVSPGGAQNFVTRVTAELSDVQRADVAAARKLGVRIGSRPFGATERNTLRALVPLSGARFDSAYLKLESSSMRTDARRASAAARNAASGAVRKLAAKHLATYRAELRVLAAAGP